MSFDIQAEVREGTGRTQSRRLRKAGRVPAVIYGGGKDTASVTLDHNSLTHQMAREAFYTSVLTLNVGNESQSVVVKDVHRHPATPQILHLDFQRVVEDQELTLNVPIHFIGEELAIGVKDQGGVIEHMLSDVEVTCLPRNLPEYLEVDVSALELNQLLHLSDIKFPEGVASVALEHDLDHPVITISPPRREEVDEVVATEGVEAAEADAAADPSDAEGAGADGDKDKDKDKDKD